MDNTEIKNIVVTAKFSKFEIINPEFTRCRCNVFYTGRNRNYSDITEKALEKFIARKGYANVPVVAHLMKKEDGSYVVGGHDSKIIFGDTIEIVDETVPFGVIPEDCNPSVDVITEKSGEKRKYFSVDIILWTHRYPIMEAAYGDEIYFNQSMEINFLDYYNDHEYVVVDDFSMSALCLLRKANNSEDNIEPCFESSMVKKYYELDTVKTGIETLKNTYAKYCNDIKEKGETREMDFSKIGEVLSQFKYTDELGAEFAKYDILSMTDTSVGVLDREDFCIYAFDWADNDGEIVIDMDSKKLSTVSVVETAEGGAAYSFKSEVEREKANARTFHEALIKSAFETEYNKKIDEVTADYEQLKEAYDEMEVQYNQYKAADEQRKADERKTKIDEVVDTYGKKMGRFSKFICYKAKIDYSRDVADIEKDLVMLMGEAIMKNEAKTSDKFSFSECRVPAAKELGKYSDNGRYGNLLAKFSE